MATTYTLISSTTLTGSQASVTFSSIPSTYTDLVLRISARSDRASNTDNGLKLQFNSDAGNNYSLRYIRGNSTSVTSSGDSTVTEWYSAVIGATGNTATASTFSSVEIYIPNYTTSSKKPFSFMGANETSAASINIGALAGLWNNTSTISSIYIIPQYPTNFVSGSSFYLYGISKN